MKVIIDLHAVQGSQNGWEHSGTRDGYLEWGDSYISDTVRVIDFLAKRFHTYLGFFFFRTSSPVFCCLSKE